MKPLALFGTPHNALVYVFASHMHMSALMHMLALHSGYVKILKEAQSEIISQQKKTFSLYLLVDPGPPFPKKPLCPFCAVTDGAHLI